MSTAEETKKKIEEIIGSKPVAIFMKGDLNFPQCGFSGTAVQVLRHVGVPEEKIACCDVLSHPDIRQGIKEYSGLLTIPQVFIRGELIGGGDDILAEAQSGELQQKLSGIIEE